MEDLRYPIGKFRPPGEITREMREQWIADLEAAPTALRKAVSGLSEEQLETPYRPGGWTVRQVVHHVPDSHLNAYIRMRLALTESEPAIKTYEEKLWSELPDARTAPPDVSLALLDALHQRWVLLLRALSGADFASTFRHPELGPMRLDVTLGLYAWHGRHHTAHITALRERKGWG